MGVLLQGSQIFQQKIGAGGIRALGMEPQVFLKKGLGQWKKKRKQRCIISQRYPPELRESGTHEDGKIRKSIRRKRGLKTIMSGWNVVFSGSYK